MPVVDVEALIEERVKALKVFHERAGIARAELDVSGGVDSATLLMLLSRALGPDCVTAVYIGIHSGEMFRARAMAAADAACVALIDLDASVVFDTLHAGMLEALTLAAHDVNGARARMAADRSIVGSIRSCLRAPIGRGFNRMTGGGIRHGTGNECEDRFVRFYQKGGDGEVDTNPLAMLSKGEVYQLARALGVPRGIRTAVPSPDLHGIGEAHTDEAELLATTGVPWTYSQVDPDGGEYTRVGTIERLSRFVDIAPELFGETAPDLDVLTDLAQESLFPAKAFDRVAVRAYLECARHTEARSRHKWNPNCPHLGSRRALLEKGLLTDVLPDVE